VTVNGRPAAGHASAIVTPLMLPPSVHWRPLCQEPVTLLPLAAGYRLAAFGGEFGITPLAYSSSSDSFNLTRHIR
jgi:hypothetical protein